MVGIAADCTELNLSHATGSHHGRHYFLSVAKEPTGARGWYLVLPPDIHQWDWLRTTGWGTRGGFSTTGGGTKGGVLIKGDLHSKAPVQLLQVEGARAVRVDCVEELAHQLHIGHVPSH